MEFAMTNEELAAAISYAFDRCDQKYVGGYTTRETDSGKEMLVHLRALLAVQLERAKLEVTPNERS